MKISKMQYLIKLWEWKQGIKIDMGMSPQEEKALLTQLIEEKKNDPSERARMDIADYLARIRELNGEPTTSYQQKIVFVDPAKLKDSGYDEGLFPASEEEIDLLAESMKEAGFFSLIVINQNKEIVSGRDRVKAAIKAGIKKIPALEINADEATQKIIAIYENIYRKTITPITYAKAKKVAEEIKRTRVSNPLAVVSEVPESIDSLPDQLPPQVPEELRRQLEAKLKQLADAVKAKMQHYEQAIKVKEEEINRRQQEIKNLKQELTEIKLEYDEKLKNASSKKTEEVMQLQKKIAELEKMISEKERLARYDIDALKAQLEDAQRRAEEANRLYEKTKKQLEKRPVIEREPDDYQKLKEELAAKRNTIKELEENIKIVKRYDSHKEALYGAFTFIRTHIHTLKTVIPHNELKALANHLITLSSIIQKEINQEVQL